MLLARWDMTQPGVTLQGGFFLTECFIQKQKTLRSVLYGLVMPMQICFYYYSTAVKLVVALGS